MGSSGKRKIEVRLFGQQEEDRVETGFWAELEKWWNGGTGQAPDVRHPEKAAVRHPEKLELRPDRMAAVRYPEKLELRLDRIPDVRYPDKGECRRTEFRM
uniref:Uncharacterized protein n=1 Tax=Vitis vinifera TaxID=29760 RepID=A5BGV6_VITVI|nr:hypothetical protein VITISV_012509 [Vitis vinifera]